MRCPDCNKFASMEMQDPEVESLEVSPDGQVSAEVRIVRVCADCSTELKEATVSMEGGFSEQVAGHTEGDSHELSVEEEAVEGTERSEGKGRGTRSFFGAVVRFSISCKCGTLGENGEGIDGEVSDDVQASAMDEMV